MRPQTKNQATNVDTPDNLRLKLQSSTPSSWKLIVPLLLGMALILGGCDAFDGLMEAETSSQIVAEDIQSPENADVIVNSVVANFECAFGNYIVSTGLLGNTLSNAGNDGNKWAWDRRTLRADLSTSDSYATNDCGIDSEALVSPLSAVRWQADDVLDKMDNEWSDAQIEDRERLTATAAAYVGYSYVLIGESMCQMAFDLGPARSTEEIFGLAEDRFSRAISVAQEIGNEEILNIARVGRARARLNLGNLEQAAQDAREVPEGFQKNAERSNQTSRTINTVAFASGDNRDLTVAEPFRNVTWNGEEDPRAPVVDNEEIGGNPTGYDGVTPMFVQRKYESRSSPLPIARWAEAQLIIAEYEVKEGDPQKAVEIINDLHARAGLPDFQSNDSGEIMDQIIYERKAELFLESHHLGDLRRYNLDLIPEPGTPYPKGGEYGDQRCVPLPDTERNNNPNIG